MDLARIILLLIIDSLIITYVGKGLLNINNGLLDLELMETKYLFIPGYNIILLITQIRILAHGKLKEKVNYSENTNLKYKIFSNNLISFLEFTDNKNNCIKRIYLEPKALCIIERLIANKKTEWLVRTHDLIKNSEPTLSLTVYVNKIGDLKIRGFRTSNKRSVIY